MSIDIIYEDKHVIVAIKPPKVPSQKDKTGDKDMLSLLKDYMKQQCGIANPYVGLIHRLDRPVGGVMVFAKTKYANTQLSEQLRNKGFDKNYYAVVCGKPHEKEAELTDYLIKLRTVNMSKVVDKKKTPNAKEAILRYEVIETVHTEEYGELTFLKIKLLTGRHHQIRVQLAHAGLPLWGDNKYNKSFVKNKKWTQIALWAGQLSFIIPKQKNPKVFSCMPKDQYPFELFKNI